MTYSQTSVKRPPLPAFKAYYFQVSFSTFESNMIIDYLTTGTTLGDNVGVDLLYTALFVFQTTFFNILFLFLAVVQISVIIAWQNFFFFLKKQF